MPKMKSNRAAKKRFRLTASGKLRYRHKNRSHILTKKTTKRKRQLRRVDFLEGQDCKNMKKLISA